MLIWGQFSCCSASGTSLPSRRCWPTPSCLPDHQPPLAAANQTHKQMTEHFQRTNITVWQKYVICLVKQVRYSVVCYTQRWDKVIVLQVKSKSQILVIKSQVKLKLKGNSTNFTHQSVFTGVVGNYCRCEKSWIKLFVVLEDSVRSLTWVSIGWVWRLQAEN